MGAGDASEKAGQRALREQMRGNGMSRAEIAAEMARRYRHRPRQAWRLAWGWTLQEAAERYNALRSRDAADPVTALTGSRMSEWEHWPRSGRKPSLLSLCLLAELYQCAVLDLLDILDRQHYPPGELIALDKTAAQATRQPAPSQARSASQTGETPTTADEILVARGAAPNSLLLAATACSLLDMLGTRPAAAATGHGRVDAEAAEGLSHVVLGYRKIYRSVGAASLLEPVCGTLSLLTDLAPAAGFYSDIIVSLIGQAGSLAGVILMLDQREFTTAARYLSIGARAAQQAGDDELLSIALACRAFHSAYGGAPPDGLAFATEAMRVAARGQIHPQTHGWVAAVASEMHATVGDEAGCMRALDIAAGQLSNPMPAEQWKGIGAFGTAKLTAYRGGDLVRLGRYRDAQAALHAALGQLDPAQSKHRCTAHIDLADAYARDGELGEAARHAISALDIIAFTRHADSLRRVAALYEQLRASKTPAVQDLGGRLLEVRAAS